MTDEQTERQPAGTREPLESNGIDPAGAAIVADSTGTRKVHVREATIALLIARTRHGPISPAAAG